MRNALVLGGSGLLGGKVVERLIAAGYSTTFTYFGNKISIPGAQDHHLDMTDEKELARTVKEVQPDLIVNAASLPSVDTCEREPELGFRVNSAPQKTVAGIAGPDTTIVFISTSNVFGYSEKPLVETDAPSPISNYGRTKFLGEEYTMSHKRHLILRSDQIYGWTRGGQKKTFVERTLERLEKDEPVEVCADWYNCPTLADDIAISLERLVSKEQYGIFHAVGPTYINRFDWALKIAEGFGHDKNLVKAIDSSKLELPAKRSNCALSNDKISMASGIRFLSVDEGLERMKNTRNIPSP